MEEDEKTIYTVHGLRRLRNGQSQSFGVDLDSLEDAEKQREGWKAPGVSTWISERKVSSFDYELFQLSRGKFEKNHVFNLGKPGEILQKCGFPKDHRIELSSSRLMLKATQGNHPFAIEDIIGLDKALQKPVAVFEYGNKEKSQNVIVELQKDDKNFLVGVFFNQKREGFEVSSIRGLFNRDNIDWFRWIEQGKMIYGNKEKIQVLAVQQRTNLADVNDKEAGTSSDLYYLDSTDSLMQKFGNVNDIFTEEYDFYKENKERYQIFKAFRNIYQDLESVETVDTPLMAKEFYDALKKGDKKTLLKYSDGEMYPEIAEKANEIIHEYNLGHPVHTADILVNYNKQVWNDYISAVRAFLPKDKLSDKKAVLEASKHALAIQVDVTGAIGIINNEFSKRGVKSSATLVKAIKEAAYPEFSKKQENKKSNDDDFGHGR